MAGVERIGGIVTARELPPGVGLDIKTLFTIYNRVIPEGMSAPCEIIGDGRPMIEDGLPCTLSNAMAIAMEELTDRGIGSPGWITYCAETYRQIPPECPGKATFSKAYPLAVSMLFVPDLQASRGMKQAAGIFAAATGLIFALFMLHKYQTAGKR